MTAAALARRALADRLAARPPAELLARYAAARDGEAFAGLVRQFGPLVLGTCRRVLGPGADADDAFQAVFVALARRAGSFRDAQALPAWLHRVALRQSRKLVARRPNAAPLADAADPADPFAAVAWRDVRRVLDEEVGRLPAAVRGAVVLCWLDGLTRDEAAGRLGVSLATVKRRLEDGRELLRVRLARRGLAPAVAAVAVLDGAGLRATVSPSLLTAAVAGARTAGSGGAWRVLAGLALVGVVAAGVGATGDRPAAADPPPAPKGAADPPSDRPKGVTAVFGSTRFRTPDDDAHGTALSPDGKLLAVGGNPVRVYEAATWEPVLTLPLDGREVADNPAFSPDGRYLAGVNSRDAFVWEVATGRLAHRLPGGDATRWGWFCAFTADGRLALSDKHRLYFYDPATGKEVRSVASGGRVVAVSADGNHFARWVKEFDPSKVVLGDAATGEVRYTFDAFTRPANGVAFSPDGRLMTLLPAHLKELQLWDVAARTMVAALPTGVEGDAERVSNIASDAVAGFTADGKTVWLRLPGGSVARWDVPSRNELPRLTAGDPPPLRVYPLPDGKTLLTPCYGGWVRLWDAATGKETPIPGRYSYGTLLALAPDGKTVAVGTAGGRIDLLDARTGNLVRTVREAGAPVVGLRFDPSGERLAVNEFTRHPNNATAEAARVLAVADGAEVRAFGPDPDDDRNTQVRVVGFTAGGRRVLLDDRYKRVRAVDLATGAEAWRFRVRYAVVVEVSPDGRLIASEDPGEVVLTDAATGAEARRILISAAEKAKPTSVGGTRFGWSADGRTLAVGLPADVVALFDPATGAERRRFVARVRPADPELVKAHDRRRPAVSGLAVSADGRRVAAATGLDGRSVGVWDAATGAVVAELPHPFRVDGLAFTPDGTALITHGSGGLGYRWELAAVTK